MQTKLRVLFAIPIGLSLAGPAAAAGYSQQNLVSDVAGSATHLDPDLKNPLAYLVRRVDAILDFGQWHGPVHAL